MCYIIQKFYIFENSLTYLWHNFYLRFSNSIQILLFVGDACQYLLLKKQLPD